MPFNSLFHQFDLNLRQYLAKNVFELESLLSTSFLRWVTFNDKTFISFPHPKLILELYTIRCYLHTYGITDTFVKVFGKEVANIFYTKLIAHKSPLLFPNVALTMFIHCPIHKLLVLKNGQGITEAHCFDEKASFHLQVLAKTFSSQDPLMVPFFHEAAYMSTYMDQFIERMQTVTNFMTKEPERARSDNLFQNLLLEILKTTYRNPIRCAISSFYTYDIGLNFSSILTSQFYDVSFFLFGADVVIDEFKQSFPFVKMAGKKIDLYVDSYPKFERTKKEVAYGPSLGKNTLIDMSSGVAYTDHNILLNLMRHKIYLREDAKQRIVGLPVEEADGSDYLAIVDARQLFFHLIRKSVQNERDQIVLRAWAAVATDISETFRDEVSFVSQNQSSRLVAIMNCFTNSVKAVPPDQCTKQGSIERNKECTNVYDLFFHHYETIQDQENMEDFIGRMDMKNNLVLEYIKKNNLKEDDPIYRITMLKLIIRDAFCSSEYRLNPADLFVPSVDVSRFLPQTDIPSISIQLFADYDNYIEFCNSFFNPSLEYVETEIEKVEAHYDCISVSVVEEQAIINVEDKTQLIEGIDLIEDQLEKKDEIQMNDAQTMDIKKNNRPLEPAKSKMREILKLVPELNGQTSYCELSAGHLGFLEEYATQNDGVLLDAFVSLNTLDPSFKREVKALSPDFRPMINVRKKVLLTDFDFDARGSIGVLKKMAPLKKHSLFVWDVSVVMDSRLAAESVTSQVLGVDKIKDKYKGYRHMGRIMSRRLAQAQMLMPHYLKIGGHLVFKCQHLIYNSSLIPLLSLSACFKDSRLLRLDSSKDTGTEFYFIGLSYIGAPVGKTYDINMLVAFIKNVHMLSLNNFRVALEAYQEKLAKKLENQKKQRGERYKKSIGR